jgi:hypothetical protein
MGKLRTEGGAVSNTTLPLLLWLVASSWASSVPRRALCPAVKTFAKATPAVPFSIGKVLRGRKDWIDATVCELSSSHPTSRGDGLPGTLETMDTPG